MAETMKLWIRDNCQGNWLGLCDQPCDKAATAALGPDKIYKRKRNCSRKWRAAVTRMSRESHETWKKRQKEWENWKNLEKRWALLQNQGKLGKIRENAFVSRRGIAIWLGTSREFNFTALPQIINSQGPIVICYLSV